MRNEQFSWPPESPHCGEKIWEQLTELQPAVLTPGQSSRHLMATSPLVSANRTASFSVLGSGNGRSTILADSSNSGEMITSMGM